MTLFVKQFTHAMLGKPWQLDGKASVEVLLHNATRQQSFQTYSDWGGMLHKDCSNNISGLDSTLSWWIFCWDRAGRIEASRVRVDVQTEFMLVLLVVYSIYVSECARLAPAELSQWHAPMVWRWPQC